MKNFVLINVASGPVRLSRTWGRPWLLTTIAMLSVTYASAQEVNLNPTRPTIANVPRYKAGTCCR
jgi:hypothetical protein